MQPVTGNSFRVPFLDGMGKVLHLDQQRAKPGRKRGSIPAGRSEWRREFARRVKESRERLTAIEGREVTQREMARLLSQAVGYQVEADEYRKYENTSSPKPTMMPHDLIFAFAELTHQTCGSLLAPLTRPRGA